MNKSIFCFAIVLSFGCSPPSKPSIETETHRVLKTMIEEEICHDRPRCPVIDVPRVELKGEWFKRSFGFAIPFQPNDSLYMQKQTEDTTSFFLKKEFLDAKISLIPNDSLETWWTKSWELQDKTLQDILKSKQFHLLDKWHRDKFRRAFFWDHFSSDSLYFEVDKPIFNQDHHYAITGYWDHYRSGSPCISALLIYKKIGDRWIKIFPRNAWRDW